MKKNWKKRKPGLLGSKPRPTTESENGLKQIISPLRASALSPGKGEFPNLMQSNSVKQGECV